MMMKPGPAYRLALGAFRLASAALARRRAGLARHAAMPDWLDPSAVNGLWLALPGADDTRPPALGVGLCAGLAPGALPCNWSLPGSGAALPLQRLPMPRAVAQSMPTLVPAVRPDLEGSATALLRDPLGPHAYLLSCGHVAAPDLRCVAGDRIALEWGGLRRGHAELRAWQPALHAGACRTPIDAALLRLDDGLSDELRAEGSLLPNAVQAQTPHADQALSLRSRRGPIGGWAKVLWSGPVDIPGLSPGVADYFLDCAVGYRCRESTLGGDSGSPIWDEQERLLGMHLAGLPGAGPNEANALYGPIQPVLDYFHVQVRLCHGLSPVPALGGRTASAPATRQAVPGPAALGGREDMITVLAQTLWGEARGEGEEGMRAVACVIANRVSSGYRGRTVAEVCLAPWQFSCWNKNDPNLPRLRDIVARPDAAFAQALRIAREAVDGRLDDITRGARHYYARSIRAPNWAAGRTPCAEIGGHLFFNNVA